MLDVSDVGITDFKSKNNMFKIIDDEIFKKLCISQISYQIVDIRTKYKYQNYHLPKAISIPYNSISIKDLKSFNKDEVLILYSDFHDSNIIFELAYILKINNYEKVLIYIVE